MADQTNVTKTAPPVVFWFKVYTVVMTGIYALCLIAGPVMICFGSQANDQDAKVFVVQGILFTVISLPLAIAFALPIFLKPKPWVWIYNLVLICIGLTSCCFLPATIPLLIYWLKPEAKVWFQRI
jgi:hypothetical protein